MNERIEKQRRDMLHEAWDSLNGIIERMVNVVRKTERTDRLVILLATALKSHRSGEAIFSLATRMYREEMSVLLRTLAESIITAAYLMDAPESELLAFVSFGAIAKHTTMTAYEALTPSQRFPEELRQRIISAANEASNNSGIPLNAREWTRTKTYQMAKKIDSIHEGLNFHLFTNSVYQHAHIFTHATLPALNFYVEHLQTGRPPYNEDRMNETNNILYGTTMASYKLALFMNVYFQLSEAEAIETGYQAMEYAYNYTGEVSAEDEETP
jgi:hypothetical protein